MEKMNLASNLFAICFVFQIVSGYIKVDLSDYEWTASSNSQSLKVPAVVPGGIYSDLLAGGILPTPLYYRFNDREYLWVAEDNWTYSATIDLDITSVLKKSAVRLECEGLDTVTTVSINGEVVGSSENMFRRFSFDVKSAVQASIGNSVNVSIFFESPIHYSKRKFLEQRDNFYVVPPECQYDGVCHANHIRKMQASFSWDWGPAFPSMGIWRPIYLEAFDSVVMKYVKWSPLYFDGVWTVSIEAIFDCSSLERCEIQGQLSVVIDEVLDEPLIWIDVQLQQISDGVSIARVSFPIDEKRIERWWPNGYGAQKLYNLTVSFIPNDFQEETSKNIRVAFRQLELIQDELTQGRAFYFKVNGIQFFAKGSNWIPAHVLPEQVTTEYVRNLLLSAKDAHMNMLRVWGGGIYESDDFYDIADELGIFLWHDFMFACSMYQANPENLDNVHHEVVHNVRRLQHHASVAVWAGNNENEIALVGNWYGTDANFSVYKEDYLKLYVETVMSAVSHEDSSRSYLVSSPSNGIHTIQQEGYFSMNPTNPLYGDMHFYMYNKDGWDPSSYPSEHYRFVSEYGFQAFPSFELLEKVSQPFDWSIVSEFASHRQRHPYGNLELLWQMRNHLEVPPRDELLGEDGFKEMVYLMFIEQAESLRTETEIYRRGMTQIDPVTGAGMTMGALYWQLNDVWPGASWATLEHGGKWKMSHYFAVNMFAPILVSPIVQDDGEIQVFVISDSLETKVNQTLEISVKKWTSFNTEHSETRIVDIPSQASTVVTTVKLKTLLQQANCSSQESPVQRLGYCFIAFRLKSENDEIISENFIKPYPKDAIGLQVPNLEIVSVSKSNFETETPGYKSTFNVHLTTDAVALYVWIEAIGIPGRFEKNGFLMDRPEMDFNFYSKDDSLTAEHLKASIQLRSYKNSILS